MKKLIYTVYVTAPNLRNNFIPPNFFIVSLLVTFNGQLKCCGYILYVLTSGRFNLGSTRVVEILNKQALSFCSSQSYKWELAENPGKLSMPAIAYLISFFSNRSILAVSRKGNYLSPTGSLFFARLIPPYLL